MPAEVLPRGIDESARSRLSSFGFSGTIAHALFAAMDAQSRNTATSGRSLYRRKKLPSLWGSSGRLAMPSLLSEGRTTHAVLSSKPFALSSHHVIAGSIVPLGVGRTDVALAVDASRRAMLSAVTFPGHTVVSQ